MMLNYVFVLSHITSGHPLQRGCSLTAELDFFSTVPQYKLYYKY